MAIGNPWGFFFPPIISFPSSFLLFLHPSFWSLSFIIASSFWGSSSDSQTHGFDDTQINKPTVIEELLYADQLKNKETDTAQPLLTVPRKNEDRMTLVQREHLSRVAEPHPLLWQHPQPTCLERDSASYTSGWAGLMPFIQASGSFWVLSARIGGALTKQMSVLQFSLLRCPLN